MVFYVLGGNTILFLLQADPAEKQPVTKAVDMLCIEPKT